MTALDTVPKIIRDAASRFATIKALWAPRKKPPVELTFAEFWQMVTQVGAGLLALGLSPGDKIALFSDNTPRWLICDQAILSIGAVDVPRGADTGNDEFAFILEHSDAVAAVVQDAKLFNRLKESPAFQGLRLVVVMDGDKPVADHPVYTFDEIRALGEGREVKFEAAFDAVAPDFLATIVYTSGTTGSPKGVMLTHQNLASQPRLVDLGDQPEPGDILMSVLPTWHAYERAAEYYGLSHGATILYSDKRYLKDDMQKHRPHLFPCVPRIWEAIYDAVQDKVRKSPPARQKLFHFFCKAGMAQLMAARASNGRDLRREPLAGPVKLSKAISAKALLPVRLLAERLVFSNIRSVTGGRIKAAISGGGSLAPYLDDFFEMIGVPILNGYGLTETSPVLSIRRLNHNVRGTVGLPLAETELEIRDEAGKAVARGVAGEIFARGPQVMVGYYKNPEATAKVLCPDGWFRTGDIGYLAASGDLVITGRAKDTIVLVSGENVEPEPIEDVARMSPYISQIVVVGQDQKYVGALIVPNFSNLAEALGLPANSPPSEICNHAQGAKLVKDSLGSIISSDKRFKSSDQVMKVVLLSEPFSEENGMLTKTMKIKRNIVAHHYAPVIEKMFS